MPDLAALHRLRPDLVLKDLPDGRVSATWTNPGGQQVTIESAVVPDTAPAVTDAIERLGGETRQERVEHARATITDLLERAWNAMQDRPNR